MDNKQNSDNPDNEQFDRIANDYTNWEMHAQDLKYASHILSNKIEEISGLWKQWKEFGTGHEEILKLAGLPMISLMLKGYAIEVFTKAIFVKRGNIVAQNGDCSFPLKGANSHNLKLMLEDISISLNEIEKRTLEKLFRIVTSFGRYPITKKSSHAPLKDQGNGIPGRLSWQEEDGQVVTMLMNKLESELNT